jgi:hypothetical protein
MTKFNERWFGLLGLAGFAGFIPGNEDFYMFFTLFFFFAFARPKTEEGTVFSDERWGANVTKACRNAFFVFLIPSMLAVAFLRSTDIFLLAVEAIPVAALLAFIAFFVYYDWRGD